MGYLVGVGGENQARAIEDQRVNSDAYNLLMQSNNGGGANNGVKTGFFPSQRTIICESKQADRFPALHFILIHLDSH